AEQLGRADDDRAEPLPDRVVGFGRRWSGRCRRFVPCRGRRRFAAGVELFRIRSPLADAVDREGHLVDVVRDAPSDRCRVMPARIILVATLITAPAVELPEFGEYSVGIRP